MSGNKHLGARNPELELKKEQKLLERLKKQLESSTETLAIMQKIAKEQSAKSSQNNNNPTSITNNPVLNSVTKNTTEDKKSSQSLDESKNSQKLKQ